MNRYSQFSVSEFKPMSFQELAIAPAAMRDQHNNALAQQEQMKLGLNAMSNPLSQHREEALALQGSMNTLIDQQAEELNAKGFTQNSGSNLIKLNREFKNLSGPTGRLGQINAAQQAYANEYKQFRDSAEKNKWSTEDINRNWNRHAGQYAGYDRDGNVSNIGTLGAPEKYEVLDFGKEIKPLVGNIKRRLDSVGGGRLVPQADGSMAVINSSGQVMKDTNVQQLNEYLKMGREIFTTPTGKGYKSGMFEGKSVGQLNTELESMINGMLVDEVTDTRNTTLGLHGYKNANEASAEKGIGDFGMFASNVQAAANPISDKGYDANMRDLSALQARVNSKTNPLSPEEYNTFNQLQSYKAHVESEFGKDPTFIKQAQDLKSKAAKLGIPDFDVNKLTSTLKKVSGRGPAEDMPMMRPNLDHMNLQEDRVVMGYKDSKVSQSQLNKLYNSDEFKNYNKLKNTIGTDVATRTQGHSIVPRDSKAQTNAGIFYNNITNILTAPGILGKDANVTKIVGTNGESSNLDPRKQAKYNDELVNLIASAKGSNRLTATTHYTGEMTGKSGLQISIEIPNGLNAKPYEVAGKKYKPGEAVTMLLEYDQSTASEFTNTTGGYFNNFVGATRAKGATQTDEYGRQFSAPNYSSNRRNSSAEITNANSEREVYNKTWGEIPDSYIENKAVHKSLQKLRELDPYLQKYELTVEDLPGLFNDARLRHPNYKLNAQ